MQDISREQVSAAMSEVIFTSNNPKDRNAERRQAVEEFLIGKPNRQWTQGSVHDMILSDLKSYPEWENEE